MIFYYSERQVYADMFIQTLGVFLRQEVKAFCPDPKEQEECDFLVIDGHKLHPKRLERVIKFCSGFVILLSNTQHDFEGIRVNLPETMPVRDVARICRTLIEKEAARQGHQLKPMEENVLGEIVKGASDKEIARQYDLPLSTVKYYLRSLYEKMGVNNRTQAALKAREFIL